MPFEGLEHEWVGHDGVRQKVEIEGEKTSESIESRGHLTTMSSPSNAIYERHWRCLMEELQREEMESASCKVTRRDQSN